MWVRGDYERNILECLENVYLYMYGGGEGVYLISPIYFFIFVILFFYFFA